MSRYIIKTMLKVLVSIVIVFNCIVGGFSSPPRKGFGCNEDILAWPAFTSEELVHRSNFCSSESSEGYFSAFLENTKVPHLSIAR